MNKLMSVATQISTSSFNSRFMGLFLGVYGLRCPLLLLWESILGFAFASHGGV